MKTQFQNTQSATLERQFAQVFGMQTQRHFVRNDSTDGMREVIVTRSTDSKGDLHIKSEMVRK